MWKTVFKKLIGIVSGNHQLGVITSWRFPKNRCYILLYRKTGLIEVARRGKNDNGFFSYSCPMQDVIWQFIVWAFILQKISEKDSDCILLVG